MSEQRFIAQEKKGLMEGTRIITDIETGVQYLFAFNGAAGGITLLVDKDGKPLLDEKYVKRTK